MLGSLGAVTSHLPQACKVQPSHPSMWPPINRLPPFVRHQVGTKGPLCWGVEV